MAKPATNQRHGTATQPAFPYTVAPKSLRRFLELAPQKPKPPKVTSSTLQTWGFKSHNDQSVLRVLKTLGLLSQNGDTTQAYADYMKAGTGAATLGKLIRKTYEALFQNVSTPEKASNQDLTNFFNINSGGSERTIQLQVDTFKALTAFATFGDADPLEQPDENDEGGGAGPKSPAIRIDLHIHLPESKTKADYDAIIESIANHLYQKRK